MEEPVPRTLEQIIGPAVQVGLLAGLVYFSFVLIGPFVPIAIWSVVLSIVLYPLFNWLANHLGARRNLAAFLTTAISLFFLIAPAAWFGVGLFGGIRTLASQLGSGAFSVPTPPEIVKTWPLIGESIYQFWSLASTNLKGAAVMIAPHLKPIAVSLSDKAGSSALEMVQFIAALIIAGFLYSPGPSLIRNLRMLLLRYFPARSEKYMDMVGTTIRAVSRGVIGIALLQATLAGVGLAVAGIPGVSLLVVLILIFSIVQIGPSIVVIPAVIWGWMSMEMTSALLFTAYMIPVNLLDNFLKPVVMTRGLSTPMTVIFVGLIGGTIAYGLVGLFVGPIVLAVAWELMRAWIDGDASGLDQAASVSTYDT